jgi:hypothetical protein
MRRLTAILIFLMVGTLMAQISMTPGMRMPDVDATPLIPVSKPKIEKSQKVMEVVVFSDINSQDFLQTLRYVESLESKSRRSGNKKWTFFFKVIVPNRKADVERFLKTAEIPVSVPLMSDNNGKTFRNFVVTRISDAVIGIDGAISWLGPVMDLDSVILSLVDGTFSMDDYRKVSRMKTEMQTALRAGLPDVAAKTAEKILEKNPGDMTCIQTVLYSYELKRQTGKAVAFLEDCIARCGKNTSGLRLLLLDRISRSGDLSLWQKAAEDAIKNCVTPDDKLNLAAFLVDMSPRFYFPAEQVPVLCADILKTSGIADDPDFYAMALEIAARAEFAVCRLEKAILYQTQAAEIRKKQNSPYLKSCMRALEYYKRVKLLSVQK